MRVRTLRATGGVATLAALAMTTPIAHAAGAVLGDGEAPAVAIDPAGTAHVVWRDHDGTVLTYCRLPRGAAACAASKTIPTGGLMATRHYVFVSGDVVRIVANVFAKPDAPTVRVEMFASADGGATFGTLPGESSRLHSTKSLRDATFGPGGAVSLVGVQTDNQLGYAHATFDSGQFDTFASLAADPYVHGAAVGLVDPETPLVVYSNRSSPALGQFRRYDGSGPRGDAANWTAAVDLGEVDAPELAAGPRGLFLMARTAAGLVVRGYDGTTFAPGTLLPNGRPTSSFDLVQDEGGRLHAVWPRHDADGTHLEHATSDDGVSWRQGSALIASEEFVAPRVVAAADHVGVAVWSFQGKVRVQAIGPDAPAAPPPPPPPPPPVNPPPPAKPGAPPQYAGPTKTVRVSTGAGRFTVRIPRNCLVASQRFRVSFSWAPSSRSRRAGRRLWRVEFRIGTRRVKLDRTRPYAALYTTPARGKRLSISARAYVGKRRSARPTTVKAALRVCS